MQVIFHKTITKDLNVLISCHSAVDQSKLEKKLFTHSEYQTVWDTMLDKWLQDNKFKYYSSQRLIGVTQVITSLTFSQSDCEEDFIKEIARYLENDYHANGYYNIEYKQFQSSN